ncbi:MAG: head GIN domain-containing protein [Bacteroidota bacterium]
MNAINKALVVILSLVVLAYSGQSCVYNVNAIRGDGNVITIETPTNDFTALQISGMFKVTLVEGTNPGVSITTDENIQEYVTIETTNGTLRLGMKKGESYDPTSLEAVITVATLEEISISGAVSIHCNHTLQAQNLALNLSGAGNMELLVDAENIKTRVSGAGNVGISGKAAKHDLGISGVASVDCIELKTNHTTVKISGAGTANVFADESLNASVSGVGSIRYDGDPTDTQVKTSGAGSIKPI